jgi:hypothetical protein
MQEKIGNTLEHIGIGNNFMNGTPVTQQLRESTDKWDYMKLKSFFTVKETVTTLKDIPQNGGKSLPPIHLTRD